jgi:dipeptide/tripeptide permease
VTEFCERLAYYGLAGSLVLFFQTQLDMSNAEADVNYSFWSGACYITPLIGGYIADTYWGRYRTILVFSSIYVVGLGEPCAMKL